VKPYYQEAGVTIYHGDSREILPQLNPESIITDPVWPQPSKLLAGADRPYELFAEMCAAIPPSVLRMAVHLGCISDPRFLGCVPRRFDFFRTCWLPQIPCSFRGRALNSGDVAYMFGIPPVGTGIIPGECSSNEHPIYPRRLPKNRAIKAYNEASEALPHPAVRKLKHVRFLVKHFAGGSACDPFGGSGTTAVACKELGVPCDLIEIEERYCELAANRLSQGVFDLKEATA
jgi:site-specific DNA-methyltransferase (adenine-specific)